MSNEIKDATQAMDIANKAAQKAGMIYWFITGTKKENTYWVVEITTLSGRYMLRINTSTGEVVDFRPAGQ